MDEILTSTSASELFSDEAPTDLAWLTSMASSNVSSSSTCWTSGMSTNGTLHEDSSQDACRPRKFFLRTFGFFSRSDEGKESF